VETKYKMDKQVMEHTQCHNEGGGGLLHDRLFWWEYQWIILMTMTDQVLL